MTSEGDAGPGYSPYYSWIGSPATFNGTNPLTGGDSCKFASLYLRRFLIRCANSDRQEQRVVAVNLTSSIAISD